MAFYSIYGMYFMIYLIFIHCHTDPKKGLLQNVPISNKIKAFWEHIYRCNSSLGKKIPGNIGGDWWRLNIKQYKSI